MGSCKPEIQKISVYICLLFDRLSLKMSEKKAVIKNADMSEDMQNDATECAKQALDKYNIEKDIAAFIKKEFDKKYNPTWHCIVGRNFGSYVTHETKHFIYFYGSSGGAALQVGLGWNIEPRSAEEEER